MEDKIHLLLSMQEHPENYADGQITQMLSDDPELAELMEQLAVTKRAFVKKEAEHEQIATDDLWEQFAKAHEEELDALDSNREQRAKAFGLPLRKLAAVFIGGVLTLGITFAAIRIVHSINHSSAQTAQSEPSVPAKPSTIVPADTVKTDTITSRQPVVFDNVRLDEMLSEIAAFYQAEISFGNDVTRQLRFYFVWKPEDGLDQAIKKLNRFESLSVRLKDNCIIVE